MFIIAIGKNFILPGNISSHLTGLDVFATVSEVIYVD